ncbi:predicted protein [Histoplasma capsulatum var. duboisii H88]|uniref:Predicted protein n=2 Tax=Ajellomyces capsulatus TaxID=5037 RepID=F0U4Y4_AJEC8|nr:predicted protein [Histoplasma capsulatum H143]EGC42027.1 predicted protein [Histoplasma capsulatum var. duboisii H88]
MLWSWTGESDGTQSGLSAKGVSRPLSVPQLSIEGTGDQFLVGQTVSNLPRMQRRQRWNRLRNVKKDIPEFDYQNNRDIYGIYLGVCRSSNGWRRVVPGGQRAEMAKVESEHDNSVNGRDSAETSSQEANGEV